MSSQHACPTLGGNLSPQLQWNVAPAGTQTFVLLMEDPDFPQSGGAPASHWVVFNMPATRRSLPQGVPAGSSIADGGAQGASQFTSISSGQAYYGPCPPTGPAHRYNFRLYAVDVSLSIPSNATRAQVLAAMEGHIVGQAALLGTFSRY